jgi:ERCC4-type nuclease
MINLKIVQTYTWLILIGIIIIMGIALLYSFNKEEANKLIGLLEKEKERAKKILTGAKKIKNIKQNIKDLQNKRNDSFSEIEKQNLDENISQFESELNAEMEAIK